MRGHVFAGIGLAVFAVVIARVRARQLLRGVARRAQHPGLRRRARAGGRSTGPRRYPRPRRARDRDLGRRGDDRRRARSCARWSAHLPLQLAQHLPAAGAARRDRDGCDTRPQSTVRGDRAPPRTGGPGRGSPTPASCSCTPHSSARCSSRCCSSSSCGVGTRSPARSSSAALPLGAVGRADASVHDCRCASPPRPAVSRSPAAWSPSPSSPTPAAAWVAPALFACGIGFGMLGGVLGPAAVPAKEANVRAATVSIAARHAGFVIGLAVIAPILASPGRHRDRRGDARHDRR